MKKRAVILDNIGKIYGRDAIYLHYSEFNDYDLILRGDLACNCCEKLTKDLSYEIIFCGISEYKVTELDYFEKFYSRGEYISSFEEIIDSEKTNFGNRKLKHFLFHTYDYIFEIVCEKFIIKT